MTKAKKTAPNKKVAKRAKPVTAAGIKICQKCFEENTLSSLVCSNCGNKKFAPEFIKKIEKGIGNTYLQVTLPQDSEEKRITLYKWWPGGKASFNINNQEQWEKIVEVIQTKLLPFLGWETKAALVKEFTAKGNAVSETQIKKLTKGYPELIRRVLQQIDVTKWEESSYADITDILSEISDLLSKTDAGFRGKLSQT